MDMERKVFEAEIKEVDASSLTCENFISTEKRDRIGDILLADGMKVEGKPMVLHSHGYGPMGSEPVARCLSLKKGEFKGRKGIIAKTQFYDGSKLTPPDNTGQRLFEKTTTGVMPSWSIGWRPLKWEFERDKKTGEETRIVSEWLLIEYSIVGVPAQTDAQTIEKGIDQICFKMLPEGEDKFGELVAWLKDDGTWEEKPYPNEHSCRILDPSGFIRIRRENDKFGKGIHAIWGIQGGGKPVELQAIRFDKTKFTVAEARKWIKDHDYKCKLFEPASEKCEKCGKPMVIKWTEDVGGDKCQKTCEAQFEYVHDGDCEKAAEMEEKGAIAYKKTPLAPEDEKWSAGEEVKKAEVKDLKVMCIWMDSEKPDIKTSYKGPHHKADGEHACVWNGVRACAAVLMGARGGMNIPEADMKKCQGHISKHYEDFGKGEPPWKSLNGEIFREALLGGNDYVNRDDPEHIFEMAKKYIPDLAEFFEPEKKDDFCTCDGEADDKGICKACQKPKKPKEPKKEDLPNVFVPEAFTKMFEDKLKEMSDSFEQKLLGINARIDVLSVKPGPELVDKGGKIENPPEPRKIVVINSEEDRKKEEADKKRSLEEMGKQLSAQISEVIKRIVPEVVKSEIDHLRGRVR